MKCVTTVVLILLTAAAGFGQRTLVFATGQSARLVIGQPEFDAESDSASQTILGSMTGLAYANNTLFVADSNMQGSPPVNNRVMVYQNISAQLPAPNAALQYNTCAPCAWGGQLVLGQPTGRAACRRPASSRPTIPDADHHSHHPHVSHDVAPDAHRYRNEQPTGVASDGTHLAVADTLNNRVLIWNTLPTTMNQPPDVVVGQTSFTTNVFPGDTPTASSLRGPQGVWIQNGMLFIADTQNDRVLIYNSIPTANGAAADIVLGQPNMTTYVQVNIADQTTSAASQQLAHAGVGDFRRDASVRRRPGLQPRADLEYDSNHQPAAADVEIGQPNMTTGISDDAFSVPTTYTGTPPPPETAVMCTVRTVWTRTATRHTRPFANTRSVSRGSRFPMARTCISPTAATIAC
jgi:hypothetical protein